MKMSIEFSSPDAKHFNSIGLWVVRIAKKEQHALCFRVGKKGGKRVKTLSSFISPFSFFTFLRNLPHTTTTTLFLENQKLVWDEFFLQHIFLTSNLILI